MAQVVYLENALANLEGAFQYLHDHDPAAAPAAVAAITGAVASLASNPLIGRRLTGEIRELIISYGKTGYIALYRFLPAQDQIRILAVRHQRELDYPVG